MKKLTTKVALKSAIKALINETASKVVKLARSNGFEIVTYHDWTDILNSDLEDYSNGKRFLKGITPFANNNLISLTTIIDDIYAGKLEVVSVADIEKFIETFNAKKVAYDKKRNPVTHATKITR